MQQNASSESSEVQLPETNSGPPLTGCVTYANEFTFLWAILPCENYIAITTFEKYILFA